MHDIVYVFLISGKKLNGKDSFFEAGKDIFNWQRVAFADKIKDISRELFDLTDEQIGGILKEEEDLRYPNTYDQESKLIQFDVDPSLISEVDIKIHKAQKYVPNEQYSPHLSPRRIFQAVGKEMRRLYQEVWVNYVFNTKVLELIANGTTAVAITDVRFPNEISFAEKWAEENPEVRKIVRIRIIRPSTLEDGNSSDESELALDAYKGWDFIIFNDGTLESLKKKAEIVAEKIANPLDRTTQTII